MNKMGNIRVYGLVIALMVMGFAGNSLAWETTGSITVTPTTGTVVGHLSRYKERCLAHQPRPK